MEYLNRLINYVRTFSLSTPSYKPYRGPWTGRIFMMIFIVISLFIFLAVEVGNGYESVAVFSPNYTQSSFLWYERFHGSLHIAPSWSCQGSVIQRGQEVVTQSGFLNYELEYFRDAASAYSEDGLLYSDDNIGNCSLLLLNLLTFDQFSNSGNDTPIVFSCTTDTNAYFVATSGSRSASWNPLGLKIFLPLITPDCAANLTVWSTSEPPTFACGMQYYWAILQGLLALLSPPSDSESAFMVALATKGISTFRIFYKANYDGTDNTPANDHWYLSIGYTLSNDTVERIIDIALSPVGTVDQIRTSQSDLNQSNSLLEPLTSFAQAQSQTNSTIDIWKLLNALFVGYYWFVLSDLSQASPVTYNDLNDFLVPSNFSQPLIYHSSTNNLYLNTTLAGNVFSNIGLNDTTLVEAITIPNWIGMKPPKLRWTYLCNQRQLKPALDLIVSVFGLALSLLHSIYAAMILLLGLILPDSQNMNPGGNQMNAGVDPGANQDLQDVNQDLQDLDRGVDQGVNQEVNQEINQGVNREVNQGDVMEMVPLLNEAEQR